MANSHLNPELLSAYLDEEVSENERALVESHLATCEACQLELESLSWTVNLLHRLPEQPVPRTFYITEAMLEPEKPPLGNWFEWLRSLLSVRGALATMAAAVLLMVVIQSSLFSSPWTGPETAALMEAQPTAALEADAPIAVAPQSSAGATLAEEAPVEEEEALFSVTAEDDSTPELAGEEEIAPAAQMAAESTAAEAQIMPEEAEAAAQIMPDEAESAADAYVLEQEAEAVAADGEIMQDEAAAAAQIVPQEADAAADAYVLEEEAEAAAADGDGDGEMMRDEAESAAEPYVLEEEAEAAAEAPPAGEASSPARREAEPLASTPEVLATQALVPPSTLTPSELTAETALEQRTEEEASSDGSVGSQNTGREIEVASSQEPIEPSQAPQMMLIATLLLLLLIAGVILWRRRPQS
ncbi:MAG: zf-HC2 domain-containing protein [Ardenticatenaceae bacterium]